MERLGRFKKGMTLLELIIAMALLSMVVMAASSLLTTFKKYYFDITKEEGKAEITSLNIFQEIGNKIKTANNLVITGQSQIDIRVDNTNPADYGDDTTHTYWFDAAARTLKYRYTINGGAPSASREVAQKVGLFICELALGANPPLNQVMISVGIETLSGNLERYETTLSSMARSAV